MKRNGLLLELTNGIAEHTLSGVVENTIFHKHVHKDHFVIFTLLIHISFEEVLGHVTLSQVSLYVAATLEKTNVYYWFELPNGI